MIEQPHGDLCYLQFSHFQQFPDLIHGIFTRQGGHSATPYQGLNTSTTLKGGGDSVENVVRNRQLTLQTLGIAKYPSVTLWQVHGSDVATFTARDEWRSDWACDSYYYESWSPQCIHKADAVITQERGVALTLSFADCTPIVLYDPVAQVTGIAHGGWRGTARGVVLATVEAMCEQFGCQPQHIRVGIGPAIGPCCYEVSETVQQHFMGSLPFDSMPTHEPYRGLVRESAVFTTVRLPDKASLRLNLRATNRNQLLMAGILPDHIEVADTCTSCHTDRFFSHRAEQGTTGRFPVIVALLDC